MNRFSLARLVLDQPVTLKLPTSRPRIGQIRTADGREATFTSFDCCFTLNTLTRSIHAEIPPIPYALRIYGSEDFADAAADTPEQHVERLKLILGDDPTSVLQALCNGDAVPQPSPRVPREIPNWRAKAILKNMGLLEKVEAMMQALPEPQKSVVSFAWNGDAKLARNGQTVVALAAALGLNDQQVDELFVAANQIEV